MHTVASTPHGRSRHTVMLGCLVLSMLHGIHWSTKILDDNLRSLCHPRLSATMVFATVDARAQREQKQRQADCINAAILSGLRSSAIALAASGTMTWLLAKYSEVGGAQACLAYIQPARRGPS